MTSSQVLPATRYRVDLKQPAAHLIEVRLDLPEPNPAGQRFMLPTWIPGSYLIREYARHVVAIRAECSGRPLAIDKIDKCTWQCAPCVGMLTVVCEIYAWDLSVRGAHFDDDHAFFNGVCVFLLPEGRREAACEVTLVRPGGGGHDDWRAATSMPETQALARRSGQFASAVRSFDAAGELHFAAVNYDDLIDHPVLAGRFESVVFEACGVPHHIVVRGRHRGDLARLAADFKRFAELQIALFEPESRAAPFDAYWFLIHAVEEGQGWGGLEHRASTALICSRDDLPPAGGGKTGARYRKLLGLASHEYFHAWNVKRILPKSFEACDLRTENYTRLLWFFEGVTSYYDDLMLVRSGLISPLEYAEIVAENLGRLLLQAGRLRQSVAEASFDAWIKYYRQDENAVNGIVSYYQKGALLGLLLDLGLRERTRDRASLDDAMRLLWKRHGKTGEGVAEEDIRGIVEELAGGDFGGFFGDAVYGTADPDFASAFARVGIAMSWCPPQSGEERATVALGAKVIGDGNGDAKLAQVHAGGAAEMAGLAAGDTIVAVDGLRVTAASLERRLRSYAVGSSAELVTFRCGELRMRRIVFTAPRPPVCSLTLENAPADAVARRRVWLGQ